MRAWRSSAVGMDLRFALMVLAFVAADFIIFACERRASPDRIFLEHIAR